MKFISWRIIESGEAYTLSVTVGEEDEASRMLDGAFYDRQLGSCGPGMKI